VTCPTGTGSASTAQPNDPTQKHDRVGASGTDSAPTLADTQPARARSDRNRKRPKLTAVGDPSGWANDAAWSVDAGAVLVHLVRVIDRRHRRRPRSTATPSGASTPRLRQSRSVFPVSSPTRTPAGGTAGVRHLLAFSTPTQPAVVSIPRGPALVGQPPSTDSTALVIDWGQTHLSGRPALAGLRGRSPHSGYATAAGVSAGSVGTQAPATRGCVLSRTAGRRRVDGDRWRHRAPPPHRRGWSL
jgi:hypothetical protein